MKNCLFYFLISTSLLMPLSASAISLRCEHEKDIFFQIIGNDGKAINRPTNLKKDTQKFTLELKGQTCVRIHDNNKESMSNPLNYFQLHALKQIQKPVQCYPQEKQPLKDKKLD